MNAKSKTRIQSRCRSVTRTWMRHCVGALALVLTGCAHSPSFDEQTVTINASSNSALTLEAVTVAPASYWQRETRRQYSQREVESLIERYQTLFNNTFNDKMQGAGWQIDDTAPQKATLEITHFRLSAPDFKGALTDLYAQDELGSATFTLSLYEGDVLIAKFVDKRDVPTTVPGKLEPTSRVRNQQAFKRVLMHFLRDCNDVLKPVFQLP